MLFRLSNPLSSILTLLYFIKIFLHYLIKNLFNLSVMEHDVNQKSKKIFGIKILQFEKLKAESLEYPQARSGHRMVCDEDGHLYILGGYNEHLINDENLKDDEDWQMTKPLFRELWKYDIYTNRWAKIKTYGNFPKQLASHCVEMLNDEVLVSFGGTAVPFELYASNHLYMFNFNTSTWSLLDTICKEESEFPSKRYGQAICLDEKEAKIYISGGTDGFNFCIDIHCFDYKNKLWTQLTHPHETTVIGRYRHEMVLYENCLYIFGGGESNKHLTLETLPVFDLKTRSWIQDCITFGDTKNGANLPKFPSPRRCHIICRYKDSLFLIGGLCKKGICHDLWKFSLKSKTWTLLVKQIPLPVYFHSATISPHGQLTFFGGITINPNENTNKRSKELFSIWIDIPSLKEMAWRAIIYYNDNFKNRSDAELIKSNLPHSYIKKIKGLL